MPELSKAVIPPHMNDIQPSEKILLLGKKITDVAAHKMKGLGDLQSLLTTKWQTLP